MKVLIACEFSGIVREAFMRRGHNAISCDLLPSEINTDKHYQGDVLDILNHGWDMMIAFPPCTYLTSSGLHWNRKFPGRKEKTNKALEFVRTLLEANIPRIALENPVGCISTQIKPPDQYIQPYEFGHDASKRTGLWLQNLPKLKPTRPSFNKIKKSNDLKLDFLGKLFKNDSIDLVKPRLVEGKARWENQSDSGQSNIPESITRAMDKSKTFIGIAEAMASQWG